ncbi:MAG: DUF3108 domain-containing protein [Desulfuromonadales bacterium]|nr:DUF3108 domain-containing protein [Desulfuromonadales bacterium]NIR34443.1 DUF3108 domain-containing protein [Desulfuromonadales bacterium]NIS42980.1 DUF3108 domain-containing protein [Desulfuromonadales bacterium]
MPSEVSTPLAELTVEDLVGERLVYDIGFLWFDKLAKGYATFSKKEDGTYEAFLEAKTRGMAALFTQHRRQNYLARMKEGPDGTLQSLVYERHIIKGKSDYKRDRSKRYVFDYEKREIAYSRGENGEYGKTKFLPMPEEGGYYDVFTAFYNFRLGRFGKVERGKRYEIPSLSRKGPSKIVVEVLTRKQQADNELFPTSGLLCRVQVDREVFDSEGGGIFVWFDEKGRPAAGVVENVLGMGNVHGSMR